jgi:hypothetical protein
MYIKQFEKTFQYSSLRGKQINHNAGIDLELSMMVMYNQTFLIE